MNPDLSTADPKEHLLLALAYYGIGITKDEGTRVSLEKEYEVEIEQGFLFKLRWRGEVVAPFDDLDEMCNFIKS